MKPDNVCIDFPEAGIFNEENILQKEVVNQIKDIIFSKRNTKDGLTFKRIIEVLEKEGPKPIHERSAIMRLNGDS